MNELAFNKEFLKKNNVLFEKTKEVADKNLEIAQKYMMK